MSGIFYDCTLNGVPILSNHAIDMDAVYLLKNYNPDLLKAPGILDVDDFAEFYPLSRKNTPTSKVVG